MPVEPEPTKELESVLHARPCLRTSAHEAHEWQESVIGSGVYETFRCPGIEDDLTPLAARTRDAMLDLFDTTKAWWDALGEPTEGAAGRVIAAEKDGLTIVVGSHGAQGDLELLIASHRARIEKAKRV